MCSKSTKIVTLCHYLHSESKLPIYEDDYDMKVIMSEVIFDIYQPLIRILQQKIVVKSIASFSYHPQIRLLSYTIKNLNC